MNTQNMTAKSVEAVNAAQRIARENGNREIDQQHLLLALVEQDGGLIPQLLAKTGVDKSAIDRMAEEAVSRIVKVSNGNGEYITAALNDAFDVAERQAKEMKDEFVSVEHLFYGLIEKPNAEVKKIFDAFGIDKNSYMKALMEVRGNVRVTSENPEDTYDVLNKYGSDLVERARTGKLDPVIGRDEEQSLPYR